MTRTRIAALDASLAGPQASIFRHQASVWGLAAALGRYEAQSALTDDEAAGLADLVALLGKPEPSAATAPTPAANRLKPGLAAEQAKTAREPGYRLVKMADVNPVAVRWLWPGRIPLGKVTMLDGDPGLGKSSLTLDIAARVTTGRPMPDETAADLDCPAGVLLLADEDDDADTIRPRLDAAGADPTRVHRLAGVTLPGGESDAPTLPRDADALLDAIQATGAKLVIIDPLMAYLGGEVNTRVDHDVRRALRYLTSVAAATGAAIVVIRHLNKSGSSNPLYRGGGSIAFTATVRSGLLVARDPDDPAGDRRILASTKSNLARLPAALEYTTEQASNGAVTIAWGGETQHTAAALLALPATDDDRGALADAEGFLLNLLADGPRLSKQIQREARAAGIADRTLHRAKAELRIKSAKDQFDGPWTWKLPSEQPKVANEAEDCQESAKIAKATDNGNLGNLRETWQSSVARAPADSEEGEV